ncbi:uncharacterized protein LOC101860832 isoform X1 [Aplysia californica]|uniref:Uncharacterized protein LOC101860832 isoform X1 n=1 Tax=Aplysia californica TaxID=6500 RepID=A0ABM1VX87_APLCA|nr:uncharacterized protein LOC101860832 isoform X1 [Aplysia californica]
MTSPRVPPDGGRRGPPPTSSGRLTTLDQTTSSLVAQSRSFASRPNGDVPQAAPTIGGTADDKGSNQGASSSNEDNSSGWLANMMVARMKVPDPEASNDGDVASQGEKGTILGKLFSGKSRVSQSKDTPSGSGRQADKKGGGGARAGQGKKEDKDKKPVLSKAFGLFSKTKDGPRREDEEFKREVAKELRRRTENYGFGVHATEAHNRGSKTNNPPVQSSARPPPKAHTPTSTSSSGHSRKTKPTPSPAKRISSSKKDEGAKAWLDFAVTPAGTKSSSEIERKKANFFLNLKKSHHLPSTSDTNTSTVTTGQNLSGTANPEPPNEMQGQSSSIENVTPDTNGSLADGATVAPESASSTQPQLPQKDKGKSKTGRPFLHKDQVSNENLPTAISGSSSSIGKSVTFVNDLETTPSTTGREKINRSPKPKATVLRPTHAEKGMSVKRVVFFQNRFIVLEKTEKPQSPKRMIYTDKNAPPTPSISDSTVSGTTSVTPSPATIDAPHEHSNVADAFLAAVASCGVKVVTRADVSGVPSSSANGRIPHSEQEDEQNERKETRPPVPSPSSTTDQRNIKANPTVTVEFHGGVTGDNTRHSSRSTNQIGRVEDLGIDPRPGPSLASRGDTNSSNNVASVSGVSGRKSGQSKNPSTIREEKNKKSGDSHRAKTGRVSDDSSSSKQRQVDLTVKGQSSQTVVPRPGTSTGSTDPKGQRKGDGSPRCGGKMDSRKSPPRERHSSSQNTITFLDSETVTKERDGQSRANPRGQKRHSVDNVSNTRGTNVQDPYRRENTKSDVNKTRVESSDTPVHSPQGNSPSGPRNIWERRGQTFVLKAVDVAQDESTPKEEEYEEEFPQFSKHAVHFEGYKTAFRNILQNSNSNACFETARDHRLSELEDVFEETDGFTSDENSPVSALTSERARQSDRNVPHDGGDSRPPRRQIESQQQQGNRKGDKQPNGNSCEQSDQQPKDYFHILLEPKPDQDVLNRKPKQSQYQQLQQQQQKQQRQQQRSQSHKPSKGKHRHKLSSSTPSSSNVPYDIHHDNHGSHLHHPRDLPDSHPPNSHHDRRNQHTHPDQYHSQTTPYELSSSPPRNFTLKSTPDKKRHRHSTSSSSKSSPTMPHIKFTASSPPRPLSPSFTYASTSHSPPLPDRSQPGATTNRDPPHKQRLSERVSSTSVPPPSSTSPLHTPSPDHKTISSIATRSESHKRETARGARQRAADMLEKTRQNTETIEKTRQRNSNDDERDASGTPRDTGHDEGYALVPALGDVIYQGFAKSGFYPGGQQQQKQQQQQRQQQQDLNSHAMSANQTSGESHSRTGNAMSPKGHITEDSHNHDPQQGHSGHASQDDVTNSSTRRRDRTEPSHHHRSRRRTHIPSDHVTGDPQDPRDQSHHSGYSPVTDDSRHGTHRTLRPHNHKTLDHNHHNHKHYYDSDNTSSHKPSPADNTDHLDPINDTYSCHDSQYPVLNSALRKQETNKASRKKEVSKERGKERRLEEGIGDVVDGGFGECRKRSVQDGNIEGLYNQNVNKKATEKEMEESLKEEEKEGTKREELYGLKDAIKEEKTEERREVVQEGKESLAEVWNEEVLEVGENIKKKKKKKNIFLFRKKKVVKEEKKVGSMSSPRADPLSQCQVTDVSEPVASTSSSCSMGLHDKSRLTTGESNSHKSGQPHEQPLRLGVRRRRDDIGDQMMDNGEMTESREAGRGEQQLITRHMRDRRKDEGGEGKEEESQRDRKQSRAINEGAEDNENDGNEVEEKNQKQNTRRKKSQIDKNRVKDICGQHGPQQAAVRQAGPDRSSSAETDAAVAAEAGGEQLRFEERRTTECGQTTTTSTTDVSTAAAAAAATKTKSDLTSATHKPARGFRAAARGRARERRQTLRGEGDATKTWLASVADSDCGGRRDSELCCAVESERRRGDNGGDTGKSSDTKRGGRGGVGGGAGDLASVPYHITACVTHESFVAPDVTPLFPTPNMDGGMDGRGIEIIVSDENDARVSTVRSGKRAVLRRIWTILLDNRVAGRPERERALRPHPEEYRVLKRVLNIVFITIGVALLISVFVVIIYTYVVDDDQLRSSSGRRTPTKTVQVPQGHNTTASNHTVPHHPGNFPSGS